MDKSYNTINSDDKKKVSVVIPNYNYSRYIIERIDSIISQTYPIYEIIILDDNSTDNSVEVIEDKIKKIDNIKVRFYRNNVNSGNVFTQWKKGFELATGDYIWIAEADDSCGCNFLETVMKGFEDDGVVLSYCESLTIDEKGTILMENLREWIDIFRCKKWDQDYIVSGIDEIKSTLCINNTIANVSSVVFKRGEYSNIIEEAKNFKLAGDWYIYMKIIENGKIAYFKESLNYHRMHSEGVTLNIDKNIEYSEIVRIQDEALNNYNLDEEIVNKVLIRRKAVGQRLGI